MSVQLILWDNPDMEWLTANHTPANTYKHPCYSAVMRRITSEPDHASWTNYERVEYLNCMLKAYQGHTNTFGIRQVSLEFATQEDLTHFVLAWS
jgi:hypothetical protein